MYNKIFSGVNIMNQLVESILSSNMSERSIAVKKISIDRPVELKDDLLRIAKEGPTYAKLSALKGYSYIISKDEIDNILEFTTNKDWHMRLETLRCISNLYGEEAIGKLKPFLKDKAYGVRSEIEKIISGFQK